MLSKSRRLLLARDSSPRSCLISPSDPFQEPVNVIWKPSASVLCLKQWAILMQPRKVTSAIVTPLKATKESLAPKTVLVVTNVLVWGEFICTGAVQVYKNCTGLIHGLVIPYSTWWSISEALYNNAPLGEIQIQKNSKEGILLTEHIPGGNESIAWGPLLLHHCLHWWHPWHPEGGWAWFNSQGKAGSNLRPAWKDRV